MKKRLLFLLAILNFTGNSFAQQKEEADSLYEIRKQELLEAVNYDYDLIKLDVAGLTYGNVNFIYERRHNLNFSFLGDAYFNYFKEYKGFGLAGGLRYYFNLEKRILDRWHKQKIKTSCLAGDYFQFDVGFYNRYGIAHHDAGTYGKFIAPTLKIGRQRASKNNRIFYDAWAGYQLPWPDNRPYDNRIMKFGLIKVGFALGLGI